ncbi:MAG: porin [Clostridiales bacterium]|nr:porin [Clostridiales bacterium]
MRRTLIVTSILLSLFLVLGGIAGAADIVEEMDFDLTGNFRFGTAEYRDADGNSFDTSLMGIEITGEFPVKDILDIRGSYLWAQEDETVPLKKYDEDYAANHDLEAVVEGKLKNTRFDLAALYNFNDFLSAGLGWVSYNFAVEGPAGYKYTAERSYRGATAAAKLQGELTKKLDAQLSFTYAPTLNVDDKVTGAYEEPDKTAETDYKGSLSDIEIGVSYEIRDNVDLQAGYHTTTVKGDGDPAHEEYRFLEHEYSHDGFYAGIEARF